MKHTGKNAPPKISKKNEFKIFLLVISKKKSANGTSENSLGKIS